MACGFAVLQAARAARSGAPADEVARRAAAVGASAGLVGMLETVRHVRQSGRLTNVQTKLVDLLRLRPIISVTQGRVRLVAVERSRRHGLERLLRLLDRATQGSAFRAAVIHADAAAEAEALADGLRARRRCGELIVSEFTPVLGGHTGPGFVGVAFAALDAGEREWPRGR